MAVIIPSYYYYYLIIWDSPSEPRQEWLVVGRFRDPRQALPSRLPTSTSTSTKIWSRLIRTIRLPYVKLTGPLWTGTYPDEPANGQILIDHLVACSPVWVVRGVLAVDVTSGAERITAMIKDAALAGSMREASEQRWTGQTKSDLRDNCGREPFRIVMEPAKIANLEFGIHLLHPSWLLDDQQIIPVHPVADLQLSWIQPNLIEILGLSLTEGHRNKEGSCRVVIGGGLTVWEASIEGVDPATSQPESEVPAFIWAGQPEQPIPILWVVLEGGGLKAGPGGKLQALTAPGGNLEGSHALVEG